MIIIGFGHKARRGKDTACSAIMEARGHQLDIQKYAFADALREEVEQALIDRWLQEGPGGPYDTQAAMQLLCRWAGVAYDPNAGVDSSYPSGKQRALLQWWGVEYRRAQDPDYWTKQTADRIARDAPDVALISDMRMPNEFEMCANGGYAVRVDRPGIDIGIGSSHPTETILDVVPDESWSHILVNKGDIENLQQDALDFFDRATAHLFKEEEAIW